MSLATRKVKRPRKRRKTKTKTKTADVVVKAQEQATHRQEEESRWAAEVQAAKKEAKMLQEGMAQVRQDARTQQEEDGRWAAVKENEGVGAAIAGTVEALLEGGFGWALQEERHGRIDFHKKLKVLKEKRLAQDGGAPLKEGRQVKDF